MDAMDGSMPYGLIDRSYFERNIKRAKKYGMGGMVVAFVFKSFPALLCFALALALALAVRRE